MIITIKKNSKQSDIKKLTDYIESLGLTVNDASSNETTLYGIIGDTSLINEDLIDSFNCIEEVIKVSKTKHTTKTNHLKDKKILIVGLGLIGGSYALGLTHYGYIPRAIDINKASIDYALDKGFIDNESLSEEELIKTSDMIICSLYPKDTMKWILDKQHLFKDNVIITDTSGVKSMIVPKINSNLKKGEFIASHPMAGRETSGVTYANRNLFKGANFIITPYNNSDYAIEVLEELAQILRFKNIETLSIEEHDDLIGFLSQLTHAVAVSLMNCQNTDHLIRYTGDSFRDLTRIAKINEKLWSELFLMNKEVLTNKIDLFIESLNNLKDKVANEEEEELKELFRSSTVSRQKFDL